MLQHCSLSSYALTCALPRPGESSVSVGGIPPCEQLRQEAASFPDGQPANISQFELSAFQWGEKSHGEFACSLEELQGSGVSGRDEAPAAVEKERQAPSRQTGQR